MMKVGVYAIGTSTTLASNKSQGRKDLARSLPSFHAIQPRLLRWGYVANFSQEVVKGQISLSVEGTKQPRSRRVRPQYGSRLSPRPPVVVS